MVIERSWRGAFVALPVLAVLTLPAAALDARSLAGWWLSIDRTFPRLWDSGAGPMEEVLIVNPDGRFEDRVMNFLSGTAEICAQRHICADLPLVAYGRLLFNAGQLRIAERGAPPNRLDTPKTDPIIRRSAISAATTWEILADGGLITLRSGTTTRLLARIEPRRLQRLRAGMRASGLPPQKHWRCFLANATEQDPAFAALRSEPAGPLAAAPPPDRPAQQTSGTGAATAPPSRAPKDFLDGYLRVASYLMTLDAKAKFPIMDDPVTRPYIGSEPEQLLVEEFRGVAAPATLADVRRLKAEEAAIETRVRDKMKEMAGGGPAPPATGRSAMSDADIAAFAFAASEEPEARRLFCRD